MREKCLKALKDRLIERANIIQARLDEERAALAKRQQNFNRDRDQMTQEEEEEYEKAVEESMFRWVSGQGGALRLLPAAVAAAARFVEFSHYSCEALL